MKRLAILALCLCVLMGTMTVPSFATDTEVAYLEDTFESATVGTTGNSYSSSVLAKGMATMEIVAGMGDAFLNRLVGMLKREKRYIGKSLGWSRL